MLPRLTIEEVSVILDTGRLGNASAAAAVFQKNKGIGEDLEDKQSVTRVEDTSISKWRYRMEYTRQTPSPRMRG